VPPRHHVRIPAPIGEESQPERPRAKAFLSSTPAPPGSKFALYGREADGELPLRFRGNLEGIGTRPQLSVEHAAGQKLVDAEIAAAL